MICHERVSCVVDICLSPFLLWGPLASGIVAPTFVWLLLIFLPASEGVDIGPYDLTSWFFSLLLAYVRVDFSIS
jgi:hypothetical protein